jgi:hypothetical protein
LSVTFDPPDAADPSPDDLVERRLAGFSLGASSAASPEAAAARRGFVAVAAGFLAALVETRAVVLARALEAVAGTGVRRGETDT